MMVAYQTHSGAVAAEALHLGLEARCRGDRLAARAYFRAAVAAEPASIRPRVELARELADLGCLQEAEEIVKAVLLDAPDQPQARALLMHLGSVGGKRPGWECREGNLPPALAAPFGQR
ncbi:MAG: tetratricopeptide repeat protein [Acetobacteraceae bacterium]|nr:tetratricopeptide repeat protein [Acetobacteraceae bacterium]